MKWITREKVKVDRVACPWLIKKFIDPQAEFVFLAGDTDWTSLKEGIVYDAPGCELGHHGEGVSFDSILKKYGLTDPALALLAQIVRAADSQPTNPHPAGEGLRWIAFGFSALGLSDQEILAREFIVYDALFAECQRRIHENALLTITHAIGYPSYVRDDSCPAGWSQPLSVTIQILTFDPNGTACTAERTCLWRLS